MKVPNRRGIRGSTTPLLFVWFFDYLVFNGTAGPHVSLDTLNPPLYARYIIEVTRPLNFSLLEPFARARVRLKEKRSSRRGDSRRTMVCVTARGVRFCNPPIKETYHQFLVQLYYTQVITFIIYPS